MCFARSSRAWAASLLVAAVCALAAACGTDAGSGNGDSPYSPAEIAEVILATQPALPALYAMTPENTDFSFRLTDAYAISPEGFEDGVICSPTGFEANEVAVLLFEDGEAAAAASGALEIYRQGRVDTYAGYAPEQSALAEGGDVVVSGRCAALLICENDEARSAFLACFDGTPPALPEIPRLAAAPAATVTVSTTAATPAPAATSMTATSTTVTTTVSTTAASAPPATATAAATTVTTVTTAVTSAVANVTIPASTTTAATATTTTAAVTQKSAPAVTTESVATVTTSQSATSPASAASTSTAAPEPPSAPAAEEDYYDASAILTAWRSGDHSALSEKNLTVLLMCRDIVDREITGEMTNYERELAIHDWITAWADYDWAEDSQNPDDKPSPDHDNPYGLLVHRKAICSGYSSTFQLFMDMLGIECVTVRGLANMTREEHAWNLVRLDDGEWYCVDVTWDDPFGESGYSEAKTHRFFNVTSKFLRDTLHFWDEETVPECTAVFYSWTE